MDGLIFPLLRAYSRRAELRLDLRHELYACAGVRVSNAGAVSVCGNWNWDWDWFRCWDARRAELVCAACAIDWLVGVVVNGSWEGQWLSYVRVWVRYEMRVCRGGRVQSQWAMAAAAAGGVRITKSRAEGWRAPKGLSHLHVAMTRWWCKGESGS